MKLRQSFAYLPENGGPSPKKEVIMESAMVSCSRVLESQIPVTTGGFKLRISYIQSSYPTH